MNLKEYFEESGIRMDWFARKIGITPASIYNICSGKHEPSLSLATLIEEHTDRKVTCWDLSHHKLRRKDADHQDIHEKSKKRERKGKDKHEHFVA